MFCAKCGKQNIDKARFCESCGSPLTAGNTPENASGNGRAVASVEQKVHPAAPVAPPVAPVAPSVAARPMAPIAPPPMPKTEGSSAGRTLLSIICMILIFFVGIATMLLVTARVGLGSGMANGITSIDYEKLLDAEELSARISESSGNVSKEDVLKVFENKEVRKFFDKVLIEYSDYLLFGEEMENFSGEKFVECIRDNEDEIEDILGITLAEEQYEELESFFDNRAVDELEETMGTEELKGVHKVLSMKTILICVGILVLLLMLLCLIRRWRADSFLWSGISLLIPSVITFLIGFLFTTLLKKEMNSSSGGGAVEEMAKEIGNSIVNSLTLCTVVFVLLSVALIVTYVIIKNVNKSKSKAAF